MIRNRSNFKQLWSESRWIILGIAWLAGLALGITGFIQYSQDHALGWSLADALYRTLQLIILESGSFSLDANWMLEIARFLLPALTTYTVLQAFLHFFQEQTRWLRLWRIRDHVVICGLGRKGNHLARELLARGEKVVVIEKESGHPYAAEIQRQGAILLNGDADDRDLLAGARLKRASHLVCLLGEDYQNLQVAFQAEEMTRQRRTGVLNCIVHLASPELLNLVKSRELLSEGAVHFHLETFDPYARAARLLLQEDPAWQDFGGTETRPGHLLVIGLGQLGENLLLQAAYAWYRRRQRDPLRITILDREAAGKTEKLLRKVPRLGSVCKVRPLQVDFSDNYHLQESLQAAAADEPVGRAYICTGDPLLNLQVCLTLLQTPALRSVPVHVRVGKESGLSGFLERYLAGASRPGQVLPFDLYERTCSAALLMDGPHERLARDLHEQYCAGLDISQANLPACLPWEQLSAEFKQANRRQAVRLIRLLQSAGFSINPLSDWDAGDLSFTPADVERMAHLEHDLWRQDKQADGWRQGPARDKKQRTHPDLVDWEELPEPERDKNRAVMRRMPGLLAQVGYQVDPT